MRGTFGNRIIETNEALRNSKFTTDMDIVAALDEIAYSLANIADNLNRIEMHLNKEEEE